MSTLKLTAAVLVAGSIAVAAPAFAQRTSTYPEGSIFGNPPAAAARPPVPPQQAKASPLNPLDQPGGEGAWKPSNRDAGNLAAQRWQDYDNQRAAVAPVR